MKIENKAIIVTGFSKEIAMLLAKNGTMI